MLLKETEPIGYGQSIYGAIYHVCIFLSICYLLFNEERETETQRDREREGERAEGRERRIFLSN